MGDTGSLALGGALAGLAILSRTELLLVILGGLFVIITLSVIIQVGFFKMTGRRVFRMAPLQHHFELAGWAEVTIVIRFWVIRAVGGLRIGGVLRRVGDRNVTVLGLMDPRCVAGIGRPGGRPPEHCSISVPRHRETTASGTSRRRGRACARGGATVTLGTGTALPEHRSRRDLTRVAPDCASAPAAAAARRRCGGDVELALAARATGDPWLSLTGTNGKTTTARMLAAMLTRRGQPHCCRGQRRHAGARRGPRGPRTTSSPSSCPATSCTGRTVRAHSAAVLNLAPDHLDWHGSMDRVRGTRH